MATDLSNRDALFKAKDEPPPLMGVEDLASIAERSFRMLELVRDRMLAPDARKRPPAFNATQVAELCGITSRAMIERLNRIKEQPADQKELPEGTVVSRARREFSLGEALRWVRAYRSEHFRPTGARMKTISCGNFKGGSTKTSTTACLAQGLTLLGHKVLVIDLDPQGTCTTLFGFNPELDIEEEQTLSLLFAGHADSLVPSIQKTYWEGIDLIAAGPLLFGADIALPVRQANLQRTGQRFRFWEVLRDALVEVQDRYDVCLIDTPPSLSPITVNALMASDGIIVPMPPSTLDFSSSVQFFGLFSDMTRRLYPEGSGATKTFGFMHILLSKVNPNDGATDIVREWITKTYGERVLPAEVPLTTVATVASAKFGTIYDLSQYPGSARTYARAREAFDRVCLLVEKSVEREWARDLQPAPATPAPAEAAAAESTGVS